MYNKITIIGNLVREPEIRYSEDGVAIATFRIANNIKSKDKEETVFISVICFNGTAENAVQFLTKGSKVLVEGRYRQRIFETNQGEKRHVDEIVANQIVFLDNKKSEANIPSEVELHEEPF